MSSSSQGSRAATPKSAATEISRELKMSIRLGLSTAYRGASKAGLEVDARAFFIRHAQVLREQAGAIDRLIEEWDRLEAAHSADETPGTNT